MSVLPSTQFWILRSAPIRQCQKAISHNGLWWRGYQYCRRLWASLPKARRNCHADLKSVLADHIEGGEVGGIPVSALSSLDAREQAYVWQPPGSYQQHQHPREREAALEIHPSTT